MKLSLVSWVLFSPLMLKHGDRIVLLLLEGREGADLSRKCDISYAQWKHLKICGYRLLS